MKKASLIVLNVLMLAPLGACANFNVKPVTSKDQPGIRYWRPAPFLALEEVSDGKTTRCEVKPFMLPDKTEEYAITANAGFGTVEASPTLQDGWNLTAMTGKADSKTSETLTALAALVPSLMPSAKSIPGSGTKSAPKSEAACRGLFRVDYDAAGHFKELVPVPMK